MHLRKCDQCVVRLTVKPRYLLLFHHGKKKIQYCHSPNGDAHASADHALAQVRPQHFFFTLGGGGGGGCVVRLTVKPRYLLLFKIQYRHSPNGDALVCLRSFYNGL